MKLKISHVVLLLLVFTAFGSKLLQAEEKKNSGSLLSIVELPQDVPPLPDPGESERPYYIDRNNVSLFHELLLAPVASWLKEEKFVIQAVSKINFPWQLSPQWVDASKKNLGVFGLDENQNLLIEAESPPEAGYPFGDARQINQELDPKRKAYKILWNIVYAQTPAVDVLYGLEMSWVGANSLLRQSTGEFYRQHFNTPYVEPVAQKESAPEGESETEEAAAAPETGAVEDAAKAPEADPQAAQEPKLLVEIFSGPKDLLSREALRLVYPPVVYGFSELTWRYRALAEDRVWVYSPVIEQSRRVLGSNRSDSLLGSSLTLDDIFVWSAKVQSVNAEVVDEKTLLVPFPSYELASLRVNQEGSIKEEQGATITVSMSGGGAEDGENAVVWNYDTRRFRSANPWTPVSVFFVPRRVWILELSPRDPYYAAGKQILVVDKESMLPFYKVVYNHDGSYLRTVVGGWGLATTSDNKLRFPFCAFVLSVEASQKPVTTLSSIRVQSFLGRETEKARNYQNLLYIDAHRSLMEEEDESGEAVEAESLELEEEPIEN